MHYALRAVHLGTHFAGAVWPRRVAPVGASVRRYLGDVGVDDRQLRGGQVDRL